MKEQTVTAFLDVSGAYDNVLIDVLCGVMFDKELTVGLVRFLTKKTSGFDPSQCYHSR
jgi:hypothetical protein